MTRNTLKSIQRGQTSLAILALAAGLCTLPAVASAQDAPAAKAASNDSDVVVVRGYRKAVQSAIQTKRKSDLIVDVIKGDDMASFPDANLAESIQRVPGVSITRDGGEGREITIRGLGGDFVRTTLNGIEAYSATTGSTLGVVAGINRSRGFDFSTFASELFNSVTVAKSQSAEMEEGSLAASVDLQTGKPFDKPGLRGALSAQAAYYDNNGSTSPRIAGLISDTWDTKLGKVGALFSIAYSTRLEQEDGYSDTSQSDFSDANNGFCGLAVDDPNEPGSQVINTAIPYVNALSGTGNRPANQCFSGKPSDPVAYAKINQPNVFLPRNPGLGRFTLNQKRLGITNSYQWRPDDNTRVGLDIVYSQFDQDRLDYALSNASLNRNVNGASAAFPLFAGRVDSQIMDVNVDANGQVNYMKLNNVDIKHIEEKSHTTTKTHSIALTLDQTINDRWSYNIKLGHAGSDFNQPWDVLMSYDAFNKDGYVWDSRNSVQTPFINYGYDVTNPANVTFTNAGTGLTPDIRVTQVRLSNNVGSLEGNLKYVLNSAWTLKSGFMIKSYSTKSEQTQRFFANNGPPLACTSTNNAAYSATNTACTPGGYATFNFARFAADFPGSAPLSETVNGFGKGLGMPSGSVTSWVVPNVQAYIDKVGILCNCANKYGDFTLSYATALGNNRGVEEDDTAAYVQADFDTTILGGKRLRGNIGVRYVETDMKAGGYTSATSYVGAEHRYNDLLPSLNASLDITDTLVARFAFAKVMARPYLLNLTPGGSVNSTFGAQTATIGNPNLNPFRAKNYDLSLEWYPETGAVLSAALFYKDVGTNIQTYTVIEPYSQTGLPASLLTAPVTTSDNFTVTTQLNTPGGYIEGLELNWQQPFTFLPGVWKNFGTLLNYTYVKSEQTYYLTSGTTPVVAHDQFQNVSPNSVNATLYYDDSKFSARVSVAYRDEYIVSFPFKAGVNDAFGSYATTNVDMSASYKLTPALTIKFDGLNLTDQKADQWSGKTRRAQRVYSTTGRQFFLGASYVF
ncbi:TonB-dependent receptor [Asticcacaulis solisilvae]|uniref:TonB-dependent receptor n=1 Tax=Asticcacaulis solisilvae TaxID=1217274 RepID=UPI003FD8078B